MLYLLSEMKLEGQNMPDEMSEGLPPKVHSEVLYL